MILSGSLIPSDKYFLKNFTFVVRNPLVWLRHHSSQTLRGQGEEQRLKSNVQQEEVVMTFRPVGQEGHCFLVVALHPGHVKSLTGMVT